MGVTVRGDCHPHRRAVAGARLTRGGREDTPYAVGSKEGA
ncbi:hypothetical protein FHX80_114786 [Streptomyces brevispora]|uniref:Uncharacterized protein n=1 Tax=Streptomyces brevispora TaxID=887462 RepID=A0A561V3U8_9ACTN|nr:hypothetical protein FHX80_114786 [Streptomyces brevispora]